MNAYGFALGTLMTEDPRIRVGSPGCWCIHSDDMTDTYLLMLDAIARYCGPDFTPKVVVVDCCKKEISALEKSIWMQKGRDATIGLCYFHFKRAVGDGLRDHVPGDEWTRAEILKEVDEIVFAKARRSVLPTALIRTRRPVVVLRRSGLSVVPCRWL